MPAKAEKPSAKCAGALQPAASALPYPADANEPSIDATTMTIHHERHQAAYVTNLNAALKDHGHLAALPLPGLLEQLGAVLESIRTAVRNNAGGHANHSMFWTLMGGKGGAPSGELATAVDRDDERPRVCPLDPGDPLERAGEMVRLTR